MEDNIDIDLGGLMKLFNQFNVLPRYLTAFNYAGLKVNLPFLSQEPHLVL